MTHKETFQKTEFSKGWQDFADSNQFTAASNAAMLHFTESFHPASDMASAAANEWRRQGAIQFLNILKTLNINPTRSTPPTGKQLDHTI